MAYTIPAAGRYTLPNEAVQNVRDKAMAWKQQTGIEPPASAVKQWSYEEVKGKYGSQAKEDEIALKLMNEMRNQQYQAQSQEIQGQIQEEQIKQQDAAMRAQNRANLIQLGSTGYQIYDIGDRRGWWGGKDTGKEAISEGSPKAVTSFNTPSGKALGAGFPGLNPTEAADLYTAGSGIQGLNPTEAAYMYTSGTGLTPALSSTGLSTMGSGLTVTNPVLASELYTAASPALSSVGTSTGGAALGTGAGGAAGAGAGAGLGATEGAMQGASMGSFSPWTAAVGLVVGYIVSRFLKS